MKYLLLALVCVLFACQTHRQRHVSKRDSTQLELGSSVDLWKRSLINESNFQQREQQTRSQTLVIFPVGTVSFHPDSGFRGEAKAIFMEGALAKHSAQRMDSISVRQDSQATATVQANKTHSSVTDRESMVDHKPASGFSFRWLAFALLLGCLLILTLRFWKHR